MTNTMIRWTLLLLMACVCSAQSIDHVIFVIKENRSTDEMFGTFPGVQNYCQGGNSPKRCTNNQSMSCTTVGTHDVCGNAGWCQPIQCTTPNGPECSAGDTCPQITTGKCLKSTNCPSGTVNLLEQSPTVVTLDPAHGQGNFIAELNNGAMTWTWRSGTQGTAGLVNFLQPDIPYYWQLASTYGLADNHFSTMGGPSLPNHAYLFAASSGEWNGAILAKPGSNTDPGTIKGFTNSWTCGAKHTGSSAPYTYTGTMENTQASTGTNYYGGICTNHPTVACACYCKTGAKCGDSFNPAAGGKACTTDPGCTALADTCSTQYSIGGNAGAPCLGLTTIADQIEAGLGTGPSSWGYYSNNVSWTAPAYFQNIYFNPTRWASHIHQDTAFDTAVGNCTGMCSNNHSMSCTVDSQCGGTDTCIDSVGASNGGPSGSAACSLPKIAYVSPTLNGNSDHSGQGRMSTGEAWTQARLTKYFSNPYVYAHSIVLLTWDDWGGFYDHVPPPVQDNVPTLGFRVPLICIGPYCRNKVTHTEFEFASELKCIEDVFGLSSINSRDAGAIDACGGTGTLASNTDGMVDTSQTPIPPIR
jgi:phospholipase C